MQTLDFSKLSAVQIIKARRLYNQGDFLGLYNLAVDGEMCDVSLCCGFSEAEFRKMWKAAADTHKI